MRLLVVFSHPSQESYGAALYETACRTLRAAGHDLRCHDLYREGFNPVLSTDEWHGYLDKTDQIIARHPDHVADLLWAEGIVVIYPTWYYGPPAMLKGWLERVWLPGITFEVSDAKQRRPKPKMSHIRLFVGITTSGSPWWWIKLIRDPGRSLWTRGLRVLFNRQCKTVWQQLYNMNHTSDADRAAFLRKVERRLASL
ncbi:NAD(P)H-dependent oxidoreductase [Citreicella sp. C3M06]|uniref:NAD(P)H-dependent oxidoreductase n=1 Tax=Citreicella sp. C3M06 TaxID=2841564 RepID=UPI001C088937|nr:NAD(P)H-dependent oxidoreductase [Citreicella sp. C3M06]MBU2963439.1 NAD(P)H-dependent oxidoreductase [Citreicella sp. C3M06]